MRRRFGRYQTSGRGIDKPVFRCRIEGVYCPMGVFWYSYSSRSMNFEWIVVCIEGMTAGILLRDRVRVVGFCGLVGG